MTLRDADQLQPAYVLHRRPYRDSSLLVEVLSRAAGRVGLVARGARGARRGRRGAMEPFRPVLLSWSGRGELRTLRAAEAAGPGPALRGEALFAAFYMNELMLRMLPRHDPHPGLFDAYETALQGLPLATAAALRVFEKRALEELGYAAPLTVEARTGRPVSPEDDYEFLLEEGPVAATATGMGGGIRVRGASLLALHRGELDDPRSLRDARRVLQATLRLYIGERPLRSSEMWKQLARAHAEPGAAPVVEDDLQ